MRVGDLGSWRDQKQGGGSDAVAQDPRLYGHLRGPSSYADRLLASLASYYHAAIITVFLLGNELILIFFPAP